MNSRSLSPTDVRDAPAVMDLLFPEDAPTLKELSLMLRDEEERSLTSETLTKPYVDPVVKGSRGYLINVIR